MDAIEFLGVEGTSIGYIYGPGYGDIYYPGWMNFYGPNIYGYPDEYTYWIDDNRNCIIVDNWDGRVDKLTVHTLVR